jgi:uncharacterized protein (TIGR03435 family)
MRRLVVELALTAVLAFGQSKPAFEVATVKPVAPMDQAKMLALLQSGRMPYGANISDRRAEYTYLDLKTLLTYAYNVKPYQISGPGWMESTRFDIVAKMPEGSTKDDAPRMLQSLLEERFKITTHRVSVEHPVLALVVSKGGPKLKSSAQKPSAIDENAPLQAGEMKMDGPEGPARVQVDMRTGTSVIDMGLKGRMSYKAAPGAQAIRLEFSMTTMSGFADMLAQMFTMFGGGGGRRVIDMTEIKGNYDGSLEISMTDILAMARAQGMDIGGPVVASDPGGGSSLMEAVQSMGLKLESRKAMVDQLIVDHIEKTPTEN